MGRWVLINANWHHWIVFRSSSLLDGAGWRDKRALDVPENVTLVTLPPYAPELNPVERARLYLRERCLSRRVLDDAEAIIDACRAARNAITAEQGRRKSLTNYPWIEKVVS